MNKSNQYLVFLLDEQRYALRLSAIQRVVRAVEVMPLPKGPETILGLIKAQGRIIPVINTRKLFDLPDQELKLSDRFIIARTSKRTVALAVDAVNGVISPSTQEVSQTEDIADDIEYFEGVLNLEDGMIPIHDLDQLLSCEEEIMLNNALTVEEDKK